MKIKKLDHVNLRTQQIDVLVEWYSKILGLQTGYRPPSAPNPGVWLYIGETAAIHLVRLDEPAGAGSETGLKLEHFSLSAEGREQFEQRLEANGERFTISEVKELNLVLYNIWDPDGNHIHVDFSTEE